jgi:tetratricopeptide (TPR) repeat protein
MQTALHWHQQGHHAQAREIYRAVLAECPDDPQVNHFLGLLYQQLGDDRAALPLLRKAADLLPREAQAQSVLAVSLLQTGEVDEAITRLRLAIEANPRYAPAHNSLGMALKRRGDPAAAVASYETAAALNPDAAQIHNNLANALAESGQPDRAIASYCRAIELQPAYPDALNNLGLALQAQGRLAEARKPFESALAVQPDFVDARLNLIVTLALLGEAGASKAECTRLLEQDADHALAHNYMGNACNTLGEQEQALEHYRRAVQLDPRLAEAHFQLAMVSKDAEDADAAAVSRLFEDPKTDVNDKVQLGFALGRIFEVRRQWERSFDYYRQANELKARRVAVSISRTQDLFERMKAVFNPDWLPRRSRDEAAGEQAIFVLGMPRSGTSLTEQILATHSRVTGAGELKYLGEVARAMAEATGEPYPEAVRRLADADLSGYAQRYLSNLTARAGEGQRIVDKMPQNFHHVGLIALLLPGARIIHCRRHPMATCFSLFKTLFTTGQDYSYRQSDLGRYYNLYADLMAHWDALLGDRILQLDYEALITDTEHEIRRMLDFCELEFEPACLEFHQTRRAVATASAAQVRRPIYRDAIEQWKNYQPYLEPLRAAIAARE